VKLAPATVPPHPNDEIAKQSMGDQNPKTRNPHRLRLENSGIPNPQPAQTAGFGNAEKGV